MKNKKIERNKTTTFFLRKTNKNIKKYFGMKL